MSQRYYSESPLTGETAVLTGTESHHLASVMRASVGDVVTLFDGSGCECEASIVRISKRDVQLKIESRAEVNREATVQLTLAVAMPKSDRQKWLIEKAVELGVARVVPLVTQRSVVKLKESGVERLRRAVLEASKQCGRNRLLEIVSPVSWGEFTQESPAQTYKAVAHPDGVGSTDFQVRTPAWADLAVRHTQPVIAAIGPEGGFADEEVQAAVDAGWQVISLGPRILRIETAALKLAALFLANR